MTAFFSAVGGLLLSIANSLGAGIEITSSVALMAGIFAPVTLVGVIIFAVINLIGWLFGLIF